MPGRNLARTLLASTALAMAAATPAMAQGDVAEIETLIVTANKRAENIQDVPMSVTAVSGDFLEKTGIGNVTELSRFIPSVSISQSNNNRNTTIFIRGIGTSGTNPGIEGSVGVFIDGVYILAAGPIQGNLQDISTVEVLRGPQGTLYGRNTPVGAINITSREPSQKAEGMLTARVGNYEDRALSGYVGGGISETLAGRLSFWASGRDGYEHNLFTGKDVNGTKQYGLRGRLKWTPTDNITGNFIGYYANIDSQCCTPETLAPSTATGIATAGFLAAANAVGRPFRNFDDRDRVVDDDVVGDNVTDIYGVSATFDIDLPGGHTLTSITAFNGYEDKIKSLAADGLPQETARGAQRLRREGYSEELRIASPADQRLSYLAGVYLFSETITHATRTTLGQHANRVLPNGLRFSPGDTSTFYYTQDTKSWALFGQATFNVTDSFRLVGGLRYSYDKKNGFIDADVLAGSSTAARAVFSVNHLGKVRRSEDKITWSATAQYDVAPGIMVYALAATGYKTGGFNARTAAVGVPVEFDAENSQTLELGIKSMLLGNRLVLNADIYRMKLTDFQDSILNPLTGSGFIVANAGDRRVQGFEADAEFRPIRELTIKGSLGYMDAEFTDYTAGQCYPGRPANGTQPGTCNFNGLTPSHSPKWTWSLAAQYQAPLAGTGLEVFLNGDISYTSGKMLEPLLDPRGFQDSVTLVGLRAGVAPENGKWRVSAYAKNLFDRTYILQSTLQPLNAFISAGGSAQAQGFVGWYAPPRTYGVEATVRF
ncbi:TonB-dependent receptor [Phenylobacterium sp.]|uniref:TonB-dependent receptor n=1 Tax=Phenylobacterium sp. TaxID=1871053 RepID=UPI00301D186D